MYSAMSTFIERLDSGPIMATQVIDWSCPVPFFGDVETARLATVGINPSNREFVNSSGDELNGVDRRLPTLNSLGRDSWSEVDGRQLREIVNACRRYFVTNPYDRWFRVLEQLLVGTSATFYGKRPTACHLDLIPYATAKKWGTLPLAEQRALLEASGDALGLLLRDSRIEVLVLNGASVVRHFNHLTERPLDMERMEAWSLPRADGAHIPGYAYSGVVETLGGVDLPSPIRVVGYNHNLQSSFGVTREVVANIGSWLAQVAKLEDVK